MSDDIPQHEENELLADQNPFGMDVDTSLESEPETGAEGGELHSVQPSAGVIIESPQITSGGERCPAEVLQSAGAGRKVAEGDGEGLEKGLHL